MQLTTIPMESLVQILETQLQLGGRANLVVTGDSMYPTLRHRKDMVELVPPPDKLKRGDLILYRRESGQYILHRIISRPKGDGFFCSGDNQWERESVSQPQVMALVDRFTRKGKTYRINDLSNRLWVGAWCWLFPVRRPLLALRRWVGRWKNRKCL